MILLANQSKNAMSTTTTGAATETVTINPEQSCMLVTVFVSSMNAGVSFIVDVYGTDNTGSEQQLLYSFPQVTGLDDTPLTYAVQYSGNIKIVASTNGIMSYVVRVKGIDSLPTGNAMVVSMDKTTAVWQRQVINQLVLTNELLQCILNHNRIITGLEEDEGDKF